jgi:glycosyltransferase involved in cell wall biosynthesis
MKIAYLGQMADVSQESSIAKKIRSQSTAWIEAGHAVRYFSLVPKTTVWPGLAPVETQLIARGLPGQRLLRSHALCLAIKQWQPDVIYFRYAYHSPGLPALFRRIPAVAEINSDDTGEYALSLSAPKRIYHRLTRDRILAPLSGIVTVTRELGKRFAPFGHPCAVIGNSAALTEFSLLPPSTSASRLIFIGSAGSPWHGLERIAELASLFPDIGFDIVGIDARAWRTQTAQPIPPENVTLHGFLSPSAYAPLMTGAVAAIGSLALYKNGMQEACPLKVREYLALGLPVIGACADTDIPDDADYYLRLPNNDAPLDAHRSNIAAFLEHWRGRRVPREAIAHLDTSVKETRRLAFMARVVADWHASRGRPSPVRT